MSQFAEDSTEEEVVPGASGCLVALVVIAMFVCYGLGIFTGAYGQRYLDKRKAENEHHEAFPDPNHPQQEVQAASTPEEAPLAEPLTTEHAGARITLEMATARLSRQGGSGEVKLPGLLVMRLRFKNISNQPLELSSWMHSDVRTWLAQLEDNQNHHFVSIHDSDPNVGGYLISMPQYRPVQKIAPGEEAITWLAFDIAARPVNALRLSLSAVNYGRDGMIYFDIPAGAVSEGNPID